AAGASDRHVLRPEIGVGGDESLLHGLRGKTPPFARALELRRDNDSAPRRADGSEVIRGAQSRAGPVLAVFVAREARARIEPARDREFGGGSVAGIAILR